MHNHKEIYANFNPYTFYSEQNCDFLICLLRGPLSTVFQSHYDISSS